MKDILKKIEEEIVAKHNNLRFKNSHMIEAAIKAGNSTIEKVAFVRTIFGWNLNTCQLIVHAVEDGKSFMDITNELNVKGELQ